MTENKAARTVEEPVGYDHTPTDRIPVPGDLSQEQTTERHPEPEHEDDLAVTENTGVATESSETSEAPHDVPHDVPSDVPSEEPVGAAEAIEPAPASGTGFEETELFSEDTVRRFEDRWRELQAGFVDDPGQAVRGADELVGEIMRELAERKQSLEQHWGAGPTDTEELRVVIREYRAFFKQLLNA
jgi:hypothetical protein